MGRVLGSGLLMVALVAACTSPEPWASEAEAVVQQLEAAYDQSDPLEVARFFTAGGSLDLAVWGRDVAVTPEEVVEATEDAWFNSDEFRGTTSVQSKQVFLAPDVGVIWWLAYADSGLQNWIQSYTFGAGGRTASRAYKGIEIPFDSIERGEQDVLDLYHRYLDAWNSLDPDAIADLYSLEIDTGDELRGLRWLGLDEVLASADGSPALEAGPWPSIFFHERDDLIQAIAVYRVLGECPQLEARQWVLDGSKILNEQRFIHLESARRCDEDLPDGWWADFELPPGLENNVTGGLNAGGMLIELVNAEPNQKAFAGWLVDRYLTSGLGLPKVAAIWFPPVPDCRTRAGLAIESDERYGSRHTVAVCYEHDNIESPTSESGWSPGAMALGLHELAHIWMLERLTDETRAEFTSFVGLETWKGSDTRWDERAMEHAASTIGWGLAGTADARYPIAPTTSCEDLARRFEVLTGHQPITGCEGG